MITQIVGKHIILDAFVDHPENFTKRRLKKILSSLADALELTVTEGPEFYEVELDESKLTGDVFLDECGISGFCAISASHILIHTWPLRKFISVDIFSCKEFNVAKAVEVLDMVFGLENYEATVIDRVTPRNPDDDIRHIVKTITEEINI